MASAAALKISRLRSYLWKTSVAAVLAALAEAVDWLDSFSNAEASASIITDGMVIKRLFDYLAVMLLSRFQSYWQYCGLKWEEIADELHQATGYLVWNPGIYGATWHAVRVATYPPESGGLLGIGLNPGPYGMAQTGIPFTDIKRICAYLPRLRRELEGTGIRLETPGLAPATLHPYLRLRHEASAVRIYRFLAEAFGDAENGLTQFAFANPCPLLFIEPETGENRTPADFATRIRKQHPEWSRKQVLGLLDRVTALRLECILAGVEALNARGVVLLGKDVQKAVGDILLETLGADRVVFYPHPARAVPETWSQGLIKALQEGRLLLS